MCPWRTGWSRRGWAGERKAERKAWEEAKGRPGLLQGWRGERAEVDMASPTAKVADAHPSTAQSQASPQEGDRQGRRQAKRRFNHHRSQNDKYRLLQLHEWARSPAKCHPTGPQR